MLSITLDQCRSTLDAQRLMAVIWPTNDGDPVIHVAGDPSVSSWQDLDPDWRRTFEDARDWLPLTVTPVGAAPSAGTTRGFVAVLSGARDVVVSLEHRVPRIVSAEDRHLVTALVGHLSLAMQHVRQFETARETSLTLQRSMLSATTLPAGFAVRYEPAVPPLEIGGDFYDVLPIGDHRIGIVVGDCVGRGLSAAAVMGQLRASTRALLLTGAEPAKVLEQLDSVAEFIPDAFCTTVFVAIVDTDSASRALQQRRPRATRARRGVVATRVVDRRAVGAAGGAPRRAPPAGRAPVDAGIDAHAVHRRPGRTARRSHRRPDQPRRRRGDRHRRSARRLGGRCGAEQPRPGGRLRRRRRARALPVCAWPARHRNRRRSRTG